jgi:hypothetical protein
MATQANTQIQYNQSKLSWCGFPVEHFRIAAGAAPGDTSVITPVREKLIKGVFGPVTHNLATTGLGATNVTVTLGVLSTAATATIGAVDVFLIYFPR